MRLCAPALFLGWLTRLNFCRRTPVHAPHRAWPLERWFAWSSPTLNVVPSGCTRTSDASPSKHGMRRGHACDISRKRHALVSGFAVANVVKRLRWSYSSTRADVRLFVFYYPRPLIRLHNWVFFPEYFIHATQQPQRTDINRRDLRGRSGRVEDERGSLGHSATLRFPSPLIEPDVPD